jgi:CRP/FNR family cyclic AMP-dependent transcriptional regulator
MDIGKLSENPWLAALPTNVRDELLGAVRTRRFGANHRVHSKADIADGLYGVVNGEVRISAITFSGEEIVFTRIDPGHWFGEIALLDGGDRTHDAHTTVESTIAILPKDSVIQICRDFPQVYEALVKLLCTHCRQAFAVIDDFLLYSPDQRLAKRILSRLASQPNNRLNISQQELGALIGVSRQTTNKILKTWEAKGWIKRIYRGLEIIAPAALRDIT